MMWIILFLIPIFALYAYAWWYDHERRILIRFIKENDRHEADILWHRFRIEHIKDMTWFYK